MRRRTTSWLLLAVLAAGCDGAPRRDADADLARERDRSAAQGEAQAAKVLGDVRVGTLELRVAALEKQMATLEATAASAADLNAAIDRLGNSYETAAVAGAAAPGPAREAPRGTPDARAPKDTPPGKGAPAGKDQPRERAAR